MIRVHGALRSARNKGCGLYTPRPILFSRIPHRNWGNAMSELREHLLATIAHLSTKRSRLLVEMEEVDSLLKALRREEESLAKTSRIVFPLAASQIYAGMSIRWSVLMYLAEHAQQPVDVGNIADALREGGIVSKAQSFNSNVSAVLSQMANKDEVEKKGDLFYLTENGKSAWYAIRNSEKFQNRATEKESSEGD